MMYILKTRFTLNQSHLQEVIFPSNTEDDYYTKDYQSELFEPTLPIGNSIFDTYSTIAMVQLYNETESKDKLEGYELTLEGLLKLTVQIKGKNTSEQEILLPLNALKRIYETLTTLCYEFSKPLEFHNDISNYKVIDIINKNIARNLKNNEFSTQGLQDLITPSTFDLYENIYSYFSINKDTSKERKKIIRKLQKTYIGYMIEQQNKSEKFSKFRPLEVEALVYFFEVYTSLSESKKIKSTVRKELLRRLDSLAYLCFCLKELNYLPHYLKMFTDKHLDNLSISASIEMRNN